MKNGLRAVVIASVVWASLAAHAQSNGTSEVPVRCSIWTPIVVAPTYRSVEQLPDGRITFRLCAPEAHYVGVYSVDNPEIAPIGYNEPKGLPMTKDETGLWSATTAGPVAADTYSFTFTVDGVRVPDPNGGRYGEEWMGTNSLFEVKGPAGEFQTFRHDIPHGVISELTYWSAALNTTRRMHVYTPPGYMKSDDRSYPVLYLLHGADYNDDSWSSLGRANVIMDNLLADGKAQPMIIVMPFGHTPRQLGPASEQDAVFTDIDTVNALETAGIGADFLDVLIPFVDENFRTRPDAQNRAIAGFSMGGHQALELGLTHPEVFHSIGVFSFFGGGAEFEAKHKAALEEGSETLDLVYYALGRDDGFIPDHGAQLMATLDKFGIDYVYNLSDGGHTYINWRRYLHDFLPRLFQ